MKTLCIYHSRDLDGWSSAAIVKLAMRNNVSAIVDLDKGTTEIAPPEEAQDQGTLYFKGYDYGQPIPDISEYERVIMCDVSFPKEDMLKINKDLGGTYFIWIDHHQRQIDIINPYLEEHGFPMDGLITEPGELRAACELTWDYFFGTDPMPELIRLLGRYDCFGHKGTDEELMVLQFQYGARGAMTCLNDVYEILIDENIEDIVSDIHMKGIGIYNYLCTDAEATYAKAFPMKFPNPKTNGKTIFAPLKFLAVNQERFNPINFGIDYHKDGYDGFACFWFKDGKWTFSLYNDNDSIDCAEICAIFGGGGHKGAAGFTTTDINSFLNI